MCHQAKFLKETRDFGYKDECELAKSWVGTKLDDTNEHIETQA